MYSSKLQWCKAISRQFSLATTDRRKGMIFLEHHEKETSQEKWQERVLKTRSIIISGEITQAVAEKVMGQLLILEDMGDQPIKLFINSQGGHVEAGDTIHDMIKFIKPRVIVIGTGWVASAGITIYLAAAKENRYSLPNTRYMIHQPLGGVQGQASDIRIEADEIIKMRSRINKLISDGTGQPLAKIEKDTQRNYWLGAQEAIEYGIVNQIITKSIDLKDL
jgi:ATP-dependent Clp protease protease subunit